VKENSLGELQTPCIHPLTVKTALHLMTLAVSSDHLANVCL